MKIEIDLNNPPASLVLLKTAELLVIAAGGDLEHPADGEREPGGVSELFETFAKAVEGPKPVAVAPVPASAPAATAPVFSAAPAKEPETVPTAEGLELDVNGLPWDARIHSAGRTKNADETWRNKRGVDEAERAAVEAELRGMLEPDASAVFAKPPAPSVFDAPKPTPPPAPPVTVPAPVAPVMEPATPTPEAAPLTLASVMRRAASEKKTKADLEAAYAAAGVKNAPELAAKPELLAPFSAALFGG